jgi:hypothetical protein
LHPPDGRSARVASNPGNERRVARFPEIRFSAISGILPGKALDSRNGRPERMVATRRVDIVPPRTLGLQDGDLFAYTWMNRDGGRNVTLFPPAIQ